MNDPGAKGRELLLSVWEEERCAWRPVAGIARYGRGGIDALTLEGALSGEGRVRDRKEAWMLAKLVCAGTASRWRLWGPNGGELIAKLRLTRFTTHGDMMHDIPCTLALATPERATASAELAELAPAP